MLGDQRFCLLEELQHRKHHKEIENNKTNRNNSTKLRMVSFYQKNKINLLQLRHNLLHLLQILNQIKI